MLFRQQPFLFTLQAEPIFSSFCKLCIYSFFEKCDFMLQWQVSSLLLFWCMTVISAKSKRSEKIRIKTFTGLKN